MLKRALPTVLFTLFALLVILGDYFLFSLLQYVKDRKTFEISFQGDPVSFALAGPNYQGYIDITSSPRP